MGRRPEPISSDLRLVSGDWAADRSFDDFSGENQWEFSVNFSNRHSQDLVIWFSLFSLLSMRNNWLFGFIVY
jgi:hypothetical protein